MQIFRWNMPICLVLRRTSVLPRLLGHSCLLSDISSLAEKYSLSLSFDVHLTRELEVSKLTALDTETFRNWLYSRKEISLVRRDRRQCAYNEFCASCARGLVVSAAANPSHLVVLLRRQPDQDRGCRSHSKDLRPIFYLLNKIEKHEIK